MKIALLTFLFSLNALAASKIYDVNFEIYQGSDLLSKPNVKVQTGSLAMITQNFATGNLSVEFVAMPDHQTKNNDKDAIFDFVLTFNSNNGKGSKQMNSKIKVIEGKSAELTYKSTDGADIKIKFVSKSYLEKAKAIPKTKKNK